MASTEYGVNHPLAVKRWAPDLMKVALKKTSFGQFMGRGSNALCQVKTELNKGAGDRIRFGLRYQLEGDGVEGDDTLEGKEEALVTYSDNVFINQLRHAVRSEGKMSEQRVPFSVREEARDGLSDWFADRMDTAFFNQLAGMSGVTDGKLTGHNTPTAPDTEHWVYSSAVNSTEATLDASDTITLTDIDNLVELAETLTVPIRPIDIGRGEKKYVMFLHPYQVTDLRTNTDTGQWLDIQKSAMQGGQISNNPIFTGALGEYNGVVLHRNTRVPSAVANTRRALLCGAQAMAMAFGRESNPQTFTWVEELFDYKNQLGVSGGTQWGLKKCTFNSSDHSVLTLSTYAAAHT